MQKFTNTSAHSSDGSNIPVVSDNDDDSSDCMHDEKDDNFVKFMYEDDENLL